MKIENTIIENLRRNYAGQSLDPSDAASDPIVQFNQWFAEALKSDILDPNAMTLATATPEGKPAARIVLLKSFSPDGFVFYTNYHSRKGLELKINPHAALCFAWLELSRQVRIEGIVSKTSAEDSTRYFQSRPKESQIGAWASAQSSPIKDRYTLENAVNRLQKDYENDEVLPKPEYWGGYSLKPTRMEFWQGRPNRLHDRVQYTSDDAGWNIKRLAP